MNFLLVFVGLHLRDAGIAVLLVGDVVVEDYLEGGVLPAFV